MSEEISNFTMEMASNDFEDDSKTWSEDLNGTQTTQENVNDLENDHDSSEVHIGNCDVNMAGLYLKNLLVESGEHPRKLSSQKLKNKVGSAFSSTCCNMPPIKKSTSHMNTASPLMFNSYLAKEESPSKAQEREEKLRLLRERKLEEQKKKEEELRESIARAEEVRKRQEEERRKRMEEQRRKEEEHRALVEERRKKLWDEEFEKRQAIIKKSAEREARIDFKKPYKSAHLIHSQHGSQSPNSKDSLHNEILKLSSTVPSLAISSTMEIGSEKPNINDGSKLSRAAKVDDKRSKSVAMPGAQITKSCSVSFRLTSMGKSTSTFTSMHHLNQKIPVQSSTHQVKNHKSKSLSSGLDKDSSRSKPRTITKKSSTGIEQRSIPDFSLRSPSKSRARSTGTIQRNKLESDTASFLQVSKASEASHRGKLSNVKMTMKPREKTPARVTQHYSSTTSPTSQPLNSVNSIRTRRSKTPVTSKYSTDLKMNGDSATSKGFSNIAPDGVMAKSMESTLSMKVRTVKMRPSLTPDMQKEKCKEKPKKSVPKKVMDLPLKSEIYGETGGSTNEALHTLNKGEDTGTKESQQVELVAKKLSQVEEHQRKLAENRRLAREKAEQKAEEERLEQEKLRIEEEERQKREEEEAKRQEEEELRMLEEAQRVEQERFLKAVEQENERKRLEEERLEAERKEKLMVEMKAQEEAEKREKEREEKMRKMAEEKEERKKKLEMIMKRVKADETISKIDPVQSPTNEDSPNTLSLNNATSQPTFTNSNALKNLPGEAIRIENETSSNFKSPLLQKMLGTKIKGIAKPTGTVANTANNASNATNKIFQNSDADEELKMNSSVNASFTEDFVCNQDLSTCAEENKTISPDIDISNTLGNSDLTTSESNTKVVSLPASSVEDEVREDQTGMDVQKKPHAEASCGIVLVACDYNHKGPEVSAVRKTYNTSNSADDDKIAHVNNIHCALLEDRDFSSAASNFPIEEFLSPKFIDCDSSLTSDLSKYALDLPQTTSHDSPNASPIASPIGDESSMPIMTDTSQSIEAEEQSRSSNTVSDEDDDSHGSENSQEHSTRPIKTVNLVKNVGISEELFNKINEKGIARSVQETAADSFGMVWSTELDDRDIHPDVFVGPCLPHNENSGTGDGLQKNFVFTSTISE